MTNRLVRTLDLNNLKSYNFKIYIFMYEILLKQKIRLCWFKYKIDLKIIFL